MKFPNHIILDVKTKPLKTSSQYWVFKFIFSKNKNTNFFYNFSFHKKFFLNKEKIFNNIRFSKSFKFTMRHNQYSPIKYFFPSKIELVEKTFTDKIKVKRKNNIATNDLKKAHMFFQHKHNQYNVFNLNTAFRLIFPKDQFITNKNSLLWNIFNINFLKKEKIYTKLKYSRVPQYDIVSGGVAALFSGFLGFLICEKFGFELLDSGDFYVLFMYFVFLSFFLRLLLKITDSTSTSWNLISLKWFLFFYKSCCVLLFKNLINFSKKI